MKYKTTNKELKEGYYYIITAGYCELQNLLKYKSPVAYNAGVYGWNYDVYDINGVAIVTGYRCCAAKHSKADYKLIRQYDDEAQRGIKTAEELDILISDFIQQAKKD